MNPVLECKFSAKLSGENSGYLNGIVVLPKNGDICVLDRENAKLKKFSATGEFAESLALIDVPHSMCLIPEAEPEIVITKPDKSILEFVEVVNNKFNIRKYIMTNIKYFGICYLGNELLAVSSWSQLCIDIINLDGTVMKTVSASRIGSPLFQTPEEVPDFLCCTSDSSLVISEINGKLKCLNEGEYDTIKWTKIVQGPVGDITLTDTGDHVLVCLLKSNFLLFLDKEGNEDGKLSLDDRGECHPIAARMLKSRVYVTVKSGDVLVYKLT